MLDEYEKLTAERLVGLDWRESQKKLQPKRAAIKILIDQIGAMNMGDTTKANALEFRAHMIGKVTIGKILTKLVDQYVSTCPTHSSDKKGRPSGRPL